MKYGVFITNYFKQDAWIQATADSMSLDDACKLLWQEKPMMMCVHSTAIEGALRRKKRKLFVAPPVFGPWPNWAEGWDPTTHALVLVGPAGIGKTRFAQSLFGSYTMIKGG